jgi:hypothetical protein
MIQIRFPRALVAPLVAVVGMLLVAPSGALAAGYTVSGTVVTSDEGKQAIVLLTSDIIGTEQPITIDMSRVPEQFQASAVGSAVSLQVEPREADAYLATGPGADEHYAERDTQGGSIRAHVANVPDDDEALTQQHRANDLRRGQDDDPANGGGGTD